VKGLPPAVDFSGLAGFQNLLFFGRRNLDHCVASAHIIGAAGRESSAAKLHKKCAISVQSHRRCGKFPW